MKSGIVVARCFHASTDLVADLFFQRLNFPKGARMSPRAQIRRGQIRAVKSGYCDKGQKKCSGEMKFSFLRKVLQDNSIVVGELKSLKIFYGLLRR